jgi:nicotinamidase-related amidase
MTTLENREKSALLVVDVQCGVVAAAHERDAVVANIGSLVEQARREHFPVVWVQHSDEQLASGSSDWQIVPELTPAAAEPLVAKRYGDAFEDTTLESVLSGLGVGRLLVVGAQTDACIRSTLHGAFVRGYDATLFSDAHTTEDHTKWGAPRRTRSSRTRTCIGPTRPRRGAPPARSKPTTSISTPRPRA